MSLDPRAEREQRALDALFGGEKERERLRLSATDADARARARLAARLARVSEVLRRSTAPSRPREARLVARVFARTTRQDLSWRGDLALALEFLRARLRASPALRIVAASLVLHLVAGPAVAYWVFRSKEPAPRFTIHFELPSESPFAPSTPPKSLENDELARLARRREGRENANARERFVLEQRGRSAPLAGELDAPLEAQLLERRARLLRDPWGGSSEAALDCPEDASPLARVLWIELELDRLVLSRGPAVGLGPACFGLEQLALDTDLAQRTPGTSMLAARALDRALRLGLVDLERPSLGSVELLDPSWFAALERAGREAGLAHTPAWRAWGAWRSP